MKFLVDNPLSPKIAQMLNKAGHDAVHVRDINMHYETDKVIFDKAFNQNRIIISADTDFSFLLSNWDKAFPSLILFRKGIDRDPLRQIELLNFNLTGEVLEALNKGSIVTLEPERIRIKQLPFGSSK
jgi:predicted nuclease of predicted toxin-antitoxin system